MKLLKTLASVAALGILAVTISCGDKGDATHASVTIYTSIYESVIAELDPLLDQKFPEIEVRWFQKGSEEVAAKVNTEIAAGAVQADLIMTSDPFWYLELKKAGHLLAYESAGASVIPSDLKDSDHAFVTVRMPVMVMTANGELLPESERPRTFKELADPKWLGRITMGDPLSSGSNFTAVAALVEKYGWEYFEALRRNEMVSAGGNSSVLNRVTTGEKAVGIILLENVLKARAENPNHPAVIIYPEDGAILVPSPIAIMNPTRVPEAARRIYDFFLSEAG